MREVRSLFQVQALIKFALWEASTLETIDSKQRALDKLFGSRGMSLLLKFNFVLHQEM